MSMPVEEGLFLDDWIARVDIAEVDVDQCRPVLTHCGLDVGDCAGLVVRNRHVGISVRAEILAGGDLPESTDLGGSFVLVVERAQIDQGGVQGGGLAEVLAVSMPLQAQCLVDCEWFSSWC